MGGVPNFRGKAADAVRRADKCRERGVDASYFDALARHWTFVADTADWAAERRLQPLDLTAARKSSRRRDA